MAQEELLIISSNPENIELLEPFLTEFALSCEMGPVDFNDILLVLTEAVNNCIHHGNNADPNKYVIISANKNDCELSFSISDEGNGFDINSIPDPTCSSNIVKPNGRGVFIIQKLAHKVVYENNGSKVSIHFNF
jgi:serine/threonine-protein kinase RsbW